VDVAVEIDVWVAVGTTGMGDAVAVGVGGNRVGVGDAETGVGEKGVYVGTLVGVLVAVTVGVLLGILVAVTVGVLVGELVAAAVGGIAPPQGYAPMSEPFVPAPQTGEPASG
jgi:hypothetical protein